MEFLHSHRLNRCANHDVNDQTAATAGLAKPDRVKISLNRVFDSSLRFRHGAFGAEQPRRGLKASKLVHVRREVVPGELERDSAFAIDSRANQCERGLVFLNNRPEKLRVRIGEFQGLVGDQPGCFEKIVVAVG